MNIITRDTHAPSNGERKAHWYMQVVHVEEYHLITGRRDAAREYEREQVLTASPSNDTPWQDYGSISHGF